MKLIDEYAAPQGRLPACLTAELELEGYANPVWIAHPLMEGERDEVARALALLEERLTPATPETLSALLDEMLAHYGKTDSIDHQVFVIAISEFSPYHIAGALQEHMRDNKQLPMPRALRDLILTRWGAATVMRYRARVLLGLQPRCWHEEPTWAEPKIRKQRIAANFVEKKQPQRRRSA